ncbi:hypothetical protein CEXT_303431, partial [Caerostris extrusa]
KWKMDHTPCEGVEQRESGESRREFFSDVFSYADSEMNFSSGIG